MSVDVPLFVPGEGVLAGDGPVSGTWLMAEASPLLFRELEHFFARQYRAEPWGKKRSKHVVGVSREPSDLQKKACGPLAPRRVVRAPSVTGRAASERGAYGRIVFLDGPSNLPPPVWDRRAAARVCADVCGTENAKNQATLRHRRSCSATGISPKHTDRSPPIRTIFSMIIQG